MKLNKDKLPIKYILGIEKDLPDYPTALDVLQAEVKLCNRNPDRYKGSFTYHALKTYRFPESDPDKILEFSDKDKYICFVQNTYLFKLNLFDAKYFIALTPSAIIGILTTI